MIATFDPLPIDMFYEYFGIFDFEWVDLLPEVDSFGDIGIEDRNFILGLGSMVIFLACFTISLNMRLFCGRCKDKRCFKRVYKAFELEGYARTIWIRFLLEAYVDFFIIGLINTENLYFFLVQTNWDWSTPDLSFSDRLSVVFGTFIFV